MKTRWGTVFHRRKSPTQIVKDIEELFHLRHQPLLLLASKEIFSPGLAFERPLFTAPFKPLIGQVILDDEDFDVDMEPLFSQVTVDKSELSRNIRQELQTRDQISLGDIISAHPLA